MNGTGVRPDTTVMAEVAREARGAGATAYLVGGAVRDFILRRSPVDLDVAVEGPARASASVVSALAARPGWACEARHERFGTATLRGPDGNRVDLAATRQETYPQPGALPVVTTGVPIGWDLARRDFTIHAMAFRLGDDGGLEDLLDPLGGRRDVGLRVIRLLSAGSLADDPTRAFRAAKYAARLGFDLDAGFGEAMRRGVASGGFSRISGDRLRSSLGDLLSEENRVVAMEILGRLGVPGAVVEGWSVSGEALGTLGAATGPADAWERLLAPVPADLRGRIAARLNFSRALRRATGCPR